MLLRVLGSVEVVHGEVPVRLGGRKERAVLAALAVHANRVVSEDALVEAIWGDEPPPTGLATLRSYVSRLRRSLDGAEGITIETRPPGYRLQVTAESFDAASAEQLLGRAREHIGSGRFAAAGELLSRAASLWLGPSLGEFAAEPFALTEATRLDELRLAIAEERLEVELGLGHHREALPDLEALSTQHPLRERLWALRVLALYRSGNQAEALRVYQQLRQHLADELGLEPTPRLRQLEAAVLAQSSALDWVPPAAAPRRRRTDAEVAGGPAAERQPAAPAAAPPPASNVPVRLSSFVGRRAERQEVAHLLAGARLVTLIGSPGVGKSRLALVVATDVLPSHPDGVWVVELAPVGEPALIAQTIASVLSIREQPGVDLLDTLAAELAGRRLLLVLDNCEHLIDGCRRVAERLLRACPGLRVLATSREPLGIDGEQVRRIQPLEVPARGDEPFDVLVAHDAVRLFAERAAQTQAGWQMTPEWAGTVAEICRRLEGVPLAIELAAARLELLSLAEVVRQLESRFRLLRGPARSAPAFHHHHSSLLATLDWSHNLLSAPEAAVLRRLSVFAGGCTLAAAERVCAGAGVDADDVMDLLAALVRKSLVFTDSSRSDTRYRLLDSVRAYAADKLSQSGERPVVMAAHGDWALDLAEQAGVDLAVGTPAGMLDRLEAEQDNIRAAHDWALAEGRAEVPLRLGAGLAQFWWLQGHVREGRHLLERALAAGRDEAAEVRARALAAAAYLIGSSGDVPAALPLARESLTLADTCGDEATRRRARHLLGLFSMYRSPVEALPALEVDVGVARGQGDQQLLGLTLFTLGSALLLVGDARAALVHLDESLEIAGRVGNGSLAASVVGAKGQAAAALGEFQEAERLFREALAMADALGERGVAGVVQSWLGDLARSQGRYDEAQVLLESALSLAHDVSRPFLVARCDCFLGRLFLDRGDLAAAQPRLDQALATAGALGLTYLTARSLLGLGEIALLEGNPGRAADAAFDEALTIALAAGDCQAVAGATLARAHLIGLQGGRSEAIRLARDALIMHHGIGDRPGVARALETVAALLPPGAEAVRLLAAARQLRDEGGYARAPAPWGDPEELVAGLRARLGDQTCATAWAEGRQRSLDETLAAATGPP